MIVFFGVTFRFVPAVFAGVCLAEVVMSANLRLIIWMTNIVDEDFFGGDRMFK